MKEWRVPSGPPHPHPRLVALGKPAGVSQAVLWRTLWYNQWRLPANHSISELGTVLPLDSGSQQHLDLRLETEPEPFNWMWDTAYHLMSSEDHLLFYSDSQQIQWASTKHDAQCWYRCSTRGCSHPASHMESNRATLQNQVSAHVILELCLLHDSAFPLLGTYVQYRSAPSCVPGVVYSVHGGNARDSLTLGITHMAIHKEMHKKNWVYFFCMYLSASELCGHELHGNKQAWLSFKAAYVGHRCPGVSFLINALRYWEWEATVTSKNKSQSKMLYVEYSLPFI